MQVKQSCQPPITEADNNAYHDQQCERITEISEYMILWAREGDEFS